MKNLLLGFLVCLVSLPAMAYVTYETDENNYITGSCLVSIGNFHASGSAEYTNGSLQCCWDGFANGTTWHPAGCASSAEYQEHQLKDVPSNFLPERSEAAHTGEDKEEKQSTHRSPRLIQGTALVN